MTKRNRSEYFKKWKLKNREKIKAWKSENAADIKEYQRKYRLKHHARIRKSIKRWQKNNREKCKIYDITSQLKRYGLTVSEYDSILLEQNDSCAICQIPQKSCKRRLHVDHDHLTGKHRGLLCPNCNHFVGWCEKNIGIVTRVESYMKKWGK